MKTERRNKTERRVNPGRRVHDEELFPTYGAKKFDEFDRRRGERRTMDRRNAS